MVSSPNPVNHGLDNWVGLVLDKHSRRLLLAGEQCSPLEPTAIGNHAEVQHQEDRRIARRMRVSSVKHTWPGRFSVGTAGV